MNNPRGITPNRDPAVHPLSQPSRSLVEELAPIADEMRQLLTDFGLRPYRVFSVVVAWSGKAIGRGNALVVSEQELLPTPLVDLSPVRTEVKTAGRVEEGDATLRQVSARYTEADLEVLFCRHPLPPGHEAFVEVRIDARDGADTKRRRFVVRGAPYRRAGDFEWTVKLSRQQEDRKPDGQLSERTEYPDRLKHPLMGE